MIPALDKFDLLAKLCEIKQSLEKKLLRQKSDNHKGLPASIAFLAAYFCCNTNKKVH